MDTTGAQPSLAVKHSRPDASWWPYSDLSPFGWQVPGNALMLPNCAPIVDSLIRLSDRDPVSSRRCSPSKRAAYQDGRSGGGWLTCWIQELDLKITMKCTGAPHCVMGAKFILKMHKSAVRQFTFPDRPLTTIDANGVTSPGEPNYMYDSYGFDPDGIPGAGGTVTKLITATLSLDKLGQQESRDGELWRTSEAGSGNLAGPVRAEKVAAGESWHAFTIAAPFTGKAGLAGRLAAAGRDPPRAIPGFPSTG